MNENLTQNIFPWTLPYIRWRRTQNVKAGEVKEERQCHDHLFLYTNRGQGTVTINGTAHEARSGRLFFILPSWWYKYRASEAEALQLLSVHFDWAARDDSPYVQPFESRTGLPQQSPVFVPGWNVSYVPWLDLRGHLDLQRAFEELNSLPIETEKNSATEVQATGWLLVLLGHLMDAVNFQARTTQQSPPATLRRLEQARVLLEDVHQIMPPDEVASSVGWSVDHLRHLCHQVYQETPLQIQLRARLGFAKQLLSEGLSVRAAAQQSGFHDPSYFARLYRREFGNAPSLARKKSRR